MVSITFDKKKLQAALSKKAHQMADETLYEAYINIKEMKISDRGKLIQSGKVVRTEKGWQAGFTAPHACIADGRTNIKTETDNKTLNMVKIQKDKVLSKDGRYHEVRRIISDLHVVQKPDLVRLKTGKCKSKEGLLVTSDHYLKK